MKLKVVVIDLEVPPRVKKWGLRLGIPLGVLLGGGAVAYAAALVTWSNGQVLTAADLNNNFSQLQSQITALQGQAHAASAFSAQLTNATPFPSTAVYPYNTVVFNSVSYDLGAEYGPTTGVFSPHAAGTYLLQCSANFVAQDGVRMTTAIMKNVNTEVAASDAQAGTAGQNLSSFAFGIVQLAVGDSVTCDIWQDGPSTSVFVTAPYLDRNSFSAARLY
jgi:hypothetical protein